LAATTAVVASFTKVWHGVKTAVKAAFMNNGLAFLLACAVAIVVTTYDAARSALPVPLQRGCDLGLNFARPPGKDDDPVAFRTGEPK
jgi:hypothetical protein